jgi:hypothetical protein
MSSEPPFDWYIAPASSFGYEQQFERLAASLGPGGPAPSHLTLALLEPVFQGAASRVDAAAFLLIWWVG